MSKPIHKVGSIINQQIFVVKTWVGVKMSMEATKKHHLELVISVNYLGQAKTVLGKLP